MTKEEKSLLLQDLCARLPFGVICNYEGVMPLGAGRAKSYDKLTGIKFYIDYNVLEFGPHKAILGDSIKPYLRPLSSMTEEEKNIVSYLNTRVILNILMVFFIEVKTTLIQFMLTIGV